jgi:hypothetical protein
MERLGVVTGVTNPQMIKAVVRSGENHFVTNREGAGPVTRIRRRHQVLARL